MTRFAVTILLAVACLAACKKYEDKAGLGDNRLERRYCNDPEAVNYNWDFPGTPDNTTCFYPDSVFLGTYTFYDSVYYSNDYIFAKADSAIITISRLSIDNHTKLSVRGFSCNADMTFTADRFFKATADSLFGSDTLIRAGQTFCRPQDTLSGFITKDRTDNKRLKVNFTVKTDTGSKVVFHVGTAIKR